MLGPKNVQKSVWRWAFATFNLGRILVQIFLHAGHELNLVLVEQIARSLCGISALAFRQMVMQTGGFAAKS